MKSVVFDIDGTMIEEVEFMRKYAPQFLKKHYGLDVEEVNQKAYKLCDMYNLQALFRGLGYEDEYAKNKAEEVSQEFWNRYFLKYSNESLKEGVKEIVNTFRDRGYAIHIVTMRGRTRKEISYKDIVVRKIIIPLLTRRQLWRAGIKFDYLKMPTDEQGKIQYIQAINPLYFFEDQLELIEQAAECIGSESKVICVANQYNEVDTFSNNVIRVTNFKDVVLKTELQKKLINNRQIQAKRYRPVTNVLYRVVKAVGMPFAYMIYKPIVCGRKRIPKDKSIAFVGNHRRKSDPIIMTGIIGQTIHWAALQRMFQGGEDLFSDSKSQLKCKMSAKFLKLMGAVPIARPDHSDYQKINLETIRFLTQQLKGKYASIGFFPEGTLNRDCSNHEILPLKSNRIFRVVTMAGSYIQPFSIVWIPDNKMVRSKVIVMFAYPINSENRDADEISEMWRNAVERNIRKSNEFVSELEKIEECNATLIQKRKMIKSKLRELKWG